jgi:hypothetical protein
MHQRFATVVCALLIATTSAGCSSTYIPRPSARLSMRMDSGSLVWERDGKKFESGLFGGEIEQAVRGVPLAEKYANDYKTGVTGGFVTVLAGAAAVVAGSSLATDEYAQRATTVPGWSTMGVGVIAYFVGLAWLLSAAPHLYDAVNAYNDGIEGGVGPVATPSP